MQLQDHVVRLILPMWNRYTAGLTLDMERATLIDITLSHQVNIPRPMSEHQAALTQDGSLCINKTKREYHPIQIGIMIDFEYAAEVLAFRSEVSRPIRYMRSQLNSF